MTKDRCQKLCKVFDKILIAGTPLPEIIANNYLHLLNLDPESLGKYNASRITKLWLPVRSKLAFVFKLFQSIVVGRHECSYRKNIKSDVLFVSHLTNEKQLSNKDDVYFGSFPNQLSGCGISSSMSLLRHVKIGKKEILNGWGEGQIPRFLLNPSLDFLSEIRLYLEQRKSKKQLKFILEDLQVDKELARDILCHHLSSGTLNSLRVAQQVADIANQVGAKFIITTYEGHAWERLVYYYARRINPSIKCFGYQHSAVFECQHAIKRPLGAKYNPDVILTSGLIAKDILEQGQLKESEIACVGSPKHLELSAMTSKKKTCLVVPEGIISECLILFELSLEYAKQHRNQKFIWRLHPLLSFEKLKKQSSIFKNMPDNITLSEGELDGDIQKCDGVLYRGSTAVVSAINTGLKPIYYQQSSDELSIDPIYTYKEGKSIVCNQEELDLALGQDTDTKTMQSLQDFAQFFYTPLNINALLKELTP